VDKVEGRLVYPKSISSGSPEDLERKSFGLRDQHKMDIVASLTET
jgi:hypothetical protein